MRWHLLVLGLFVGLAFVGLDWHNANAGRPAGARLSLLDYAQSRLAALPSLPGGRAAKAAAPAPVDGADGFAVLVGGLIGQAILAQRDGSAAAAPAPVAVAEAAAPPPGPAPVVNRPAANRPPATGAFGRGSCGERGGGKFCSVGD